MYVDSAILIKLVVREPDSEFYADLIDGQTSVRSSELVITECRSALVRKRACGELDARTYSRAWDQLEKMWGEHGGLALVPLTRTILLEAGEIMHRINNLIPLRTLDSLHIASCLAIRAYPLITNDRIMRQAATRLQIPLSSLTKKP